MSSWYGKTTTKELDALIEKKAKLSELLLFPDFILELKAYNSKLLDYLSNNNSLMDELVQFITVAPNEADSHDRKFKFPLMAIEMIETEATCVINGMFKQSETGKTYFQNLFKLLDSNEVLPILAGYLFRTNMNLLNNRQKETIDKIYASPQIFIKLIQHSYHMSISNIIQLFLNLDINKHQNTAQNQTRLKIKLQILNQIIQKIQNQSVYKNEKSAMIIENLCGILCETIQKYYLIINGKQMMQTITNDKTITIFMSMIKTGNVSDTGFSAFNFFISLINYYSFSSFNIDDLNSEQGKKTLERLQAQPMVIQLTDFFQTALDKITKSSTITLYLYRMLQVLCHCISISSLKIYTCTKKTQFFNNLIKLMFKHQKQNILHVLIQKSFLHIFISDRKIYQIYKKHLFCQIDIIDSTAGYFMKNIPIDKLFQQGKNKCYFGHFMRILKIYSGINTQDQDIVKAIRSKSDLWSKISKHLIIPYQSIYQKKLGTYEQVPQPKYQQFQVQNNTKIKPNPMKNSTIQQIKRQENLPTSIAKTQIPTDSYSKMQAIQQKKAQEMFYRAPIQGFLTNNQIISNQNNSNNSNSTSSSMPPKPLPVRQSNHMSQSNVIDYETSTDKELKKVESFKEFMNKKKVQAEHEIKLKRSLSQQRKLSGQKTKISSPSPLKKNNSWKQESVDENDKKFPPVVIPKIPLNRKQFTQSAASERSHPMSTPPVPHINTPSATNNVQPSNHASTLSTNNTSTLSVSKQSNFVKDIKKFRCMMQTQKSVEKKFRRVNSQDKFFLNFLGIDIV